jgi:hypothetical protein
LVSRRSLGVAYLGLSAWMFAQEPAMRRGGGPGIVGFELAGAVERAEAILEAWGSEGCAAARRSLLIDYLVLATYAPLLASFCSGSVVDAAPYLAAACDVGENTALLGVLVGRRGRLPEVARGLAVTKFGLLGASLAYAGLRLAHGSRR